MLSVALKIPKCSIHRKLPLTSPAESEYSNLNDVVNAIKATYPIHK